MKPKTRKLRGDVPVGQVLLIVLAVAVVAALALVVLPALTSVKAPSMTLDAYNSKSFGGYAVFAVRTGSTIKYKGSYLLNPNGQQLATCTAYQSMADAMNKGSNVINLNSAIPGGSTFYIRCDYALSPGSYKIRIDYDAGGKTDSVVLDYAYS